jgi:hypothetical protein
MQLNISIAGEQLESQQAANQLRLMAKMVEAGVVHADGFNIEYMGEFSLDVDFGGEFPHGDYQDAEGNLLHVANDHVVNVTWASKGAEVEEVSIPVEEWIEKHGEIQPAGHGEGHHHDHG